MTRRSRIWFVVAVLFTILNLGGAVIAAAQGEMPHAGVHVLLMLLGALVTWWLAQGRDARLAESGYGARREEAAGAALPRELADHLTNIEQSVEAVAIEVERIGEGQRFVTRLFTERDAAQPVESGVRETTPPDGSARRAT
jgi:hypothetical protein